MFDFKDLFEASSLLHAIELSREYPDSLIIAGGSDILIKIREKKLRNCQLISIQSLDELRGIEMFGDEDIRIGALECFSSIGKNELIKKHIPVLGEASMAVGGPQVRNIGTIGGNICNGATSADTPSTLLALDAVLEITGHDGVRLIPIEQFYIDAGKVDLGKGEILTSILIKKESYLNYAGYYYKYSTRNAMDISICNCSINVKLSENKDAIEDVRAAYGAAGPVPTRVHFAEKQIKGKEITSDLIEQFAETAAVCLNPRSSYRADKEFRKHILEEMSKLCLAEAIRRGGSHGAV